MCCHHRALCGPAALTINEKVMTSLRAQVDSFQRCRNFRPQHVCCLKGLTYLPFLGTAGNREVCVFFTYRVLTLIVFGEELLELIKVY